MANTIEGFFIWCAGSDKALLNQCSKKERIKHAGLGSLVLIPAVLGFVSMSYALSTLTDSPFLYFLGGLIWASIVFAIDRFIVSTFAKRKTIAGDFFSFQFLGRMIFAVGIGIVISHPLVLLIFNDSLEQELLLMRDEGEKKLFAEYDRQIDSLNFRNDTLNSRIQAKELERKDWQTFLSYEISGKDTALACCGATTGLRYYGPATKKIEDRITTLGTEIDEMKAAQSNERNNNGQDITGLMAKRDSIITKFRNSFSFDYVAREVALSRLEARPEGGSSVSFTKWFLIILFVFVDILPVFLKMATQRGEYDARLDSEKLNILIPYGYEREKDEGIQKHFIDKLTHLRKEEIDKIFNDWDGHYLSFLERLRPYTKTKVSFPAPEENGVEKPQPVS